MLEDILPIEPPPEMPTQELRSLAFKSWFSGSQAISENGQPLMVFHGTAREDKAFNRSRHGDLEGAYFTPNFAEAADYAEMDGSVDGEQPYVIAAFLRLTNPFTMQYLDSQVISTEQRDRLEALGYDGVIGVVDGKIAEYVVFNPNQIAAFADGVLNTPEVKEKPRKKRVEPDLPEPSL